MSEELRLEPLSNDFIKHLKQQGKTENTLKEKEVGRYQEQEKREALEKELADLTEKNLKE